MLAIGTRDYRGLIRQEAAFARSLRESGARFERIRVDRNHFTIIMRFGEEDDPLIETVLEFMGILRAG